MPTGYTADIQKGITFRQFALGCARAFGACITLRDEPAGTPIPDEFTPDRYFVEALDRAKARLYDLERMTPDQIAAAAAEEYDDAVADREEDIAYRAALRQKYDAMLVQVEAWQPPTPEHENFKTFMREQIAESIKFDCGEVEERYWPTPKRLTPRDWHMQAVAKAHEDIAYRTKELADEIQRCEQRTAWVRALRGSLE